MENLWLENIHYEITAFSDLERQKKAWIDPDDAIVSSYSEDICMLFDSFCFDDFIVEWKKENLNKEILNELIIFRDKLNLYDQKIPIDNNWYDEQILNDPEWLDVVNQAKKVLQIWV
jgi:hypothetical protein